MKQGSSLVDMAKELERQNEVKIDYLADTRKMMVSQNVDKLNLLNDENNSIAELDIGDQAHRQLATKMNVPAKFYQRLQTQHPDLLAHNLNYLFANDSKQTMVRVLDNKARAVMSDGYRPLDNYDLFDAIFPVLRDAGAQFVSGEVTEKKMYIKMLCPWLDRELPMPEGAVMGEGHTIFLRKVIGAITISNSETGCGSLEIAPGIFERQCTNMMTFRGDGYRKIHVGKKRGEQDSVSQYITDRTKKIEDAAIWSRVRDVTTATMDGRVIDKIVADCIAARGDKIKGNPVKAVEVFAKKNTLSETETGGLMKHLTQSGEMTRYGMQWAVTRLAQDAEDYDRASELERLGGAVIELPKADWKTIAEAA